jgi:D-3-phosphoglycerate dehydrogenase / 2-oxoglutarate reductase
LSSASTTESMPGTARPPLRILVADGLSDRGLEPLVGDARFEIIERAGLTGEALADALAEADAVIVRSATKITREALSRAERLRVIGRAGVGVDNIDVQAATERGIAVLNAPSGNTISAAELTLALLLAVARSIPAADRSMKAGEWDRKRFNGIELHGKTLGLIGAGRIGGEVARRAKAFGMRVIAFDPFLTEERARELDLQRTPLDAVLEGADVITLHVPLTDATRGLIGDAQLARMRKGAILVNASRGGVVDEAALLRAVESGQLRGAGLDVFAEEPLPAQAALRSSDRIVLTPHLGASTAEAQENVALEIAEAVRDALLHDDLSRAVNAPAIAGEEMRRLRPLLDLGVRLGRLAAALTVGGVRRLEVRYAGGLEEAMRPLLSAACIGLLGEVVGRTAINFVNALVTAQSRGIELGRTRLAQVADFAEYVELRVAGEGDDVVVAGALRDGVLPRIVRIGPFNVDVRPYGALIVLRNRDVPGVIGRVGSALGEAGVNIAEYHQARLEVGGEALAAINIDAVLPAAAIDRLHALSDVLRVMQVQLD